MHWSLALSFCWFVLYIQAPLTCLWMVSSNSVFPFWLQPSEAASWLPGTKTRLSHGAATPQFQLPATFSLRQHYCISSSTLVLTLWEDQSSLFTAICRLCPTQQPGLVAGSQKFSDMNNNRLKSSQTQFLQKNTKHTKIPFSWHFLFLMIINAANL